MMSPDDEDSGVGSGDYEDLSTNYTTPHIPAMYSTTTDVYFNTNTTDGSNLLIKLLAIDENHLVSVLWLLTIGALLVTIVLALTTWFVIPSWRSFKHFALINVVVSKMLLLSFSIISLIYGLEIDEYGHKTVYFIAFPRIALIIWLFLSCIAFYTDKVTIVAIIDWDRHYLQACIFAWGIPLTISVIVYTSYILSPMPMFLSLIFIVVNFIIYFIVICNLMLNYKDTEYGIKTVKATIIFGTTSVFMLVPFFYEALFAINGLKILIVMNAIVLNLVFICLKSNWWAWSEYFRWHREENISWENRHGPRYNVTLTSVAMGSEGV